MKKAHFKKYIFFSMLFYAVMCISGCMKVRDNTDIEETAPKIVIGSDIYEPYLYRDEYGEFEGIDVEIATEALKRMGYAPEFKVIVWENKKDYLADGEIDCLWGCFSMNGREEEYQWAGPYLYSRQMAVVRQDSVITELNDLVGKMVAVQETSKAEEYFLHSTDSNVPEVKLVYCFSSMDEVFAHLEKIMWTQSAGMRMRLGHLSGRHRMSTDCWMEAFWFQVLEQRLTMDMILSSCRSLEKFLMI